MKTLVPVISLSVSFFSTISRLETTIEVLISRQDMLRICSPIAYLTEGQDAILVSSF